MRKPEKRKLERVQYWQGQMLRSRDFRDIETGNAQRRWWHNRALHNAYGIADGLTSSLVLSGMPPGVLVLPGVAYDISGRELILERSQLIPLPSVPPNLTGTITLLMSYKARLGALRPDENSELCWTVSGWVGAGTAEFVWKQGSNFDPTEGVAICAVDYTKGKVRAPEFQLRAFSRSQSRPLLASGTTIPGNTPWDPWSAGFTFDFNDNQIPDLIGVQTWIDTSAAGFTQVPCYFAWLQGALWNSQTRQLTPAVFPSIADESVKGFTFRLWLQAIPPPSIGINEALPRRRIAAASTAFTFSIVTDPGDFSLFARQQQLYVSWVGCQMQAQVSCCGQQKSAAVAAPTRLMTSSRNT
jgi:hypothetical protein